MISKKNLNTARTEAYIARANQELSRLELYPSLMRIQRTVQYDIVELVGTAAYFDTLHEPSGHTATELRCEGHVLIDYESDESDVCHAVQRLLLRTLYEFRD